MERKSTQKQTEPPSPAVFLPLGIALLIGARQETGWLRVLLWFFSGAVFVGILFLALRRNRPGKNPQR